jgi:hypothetical protein
MYDVQSYRDYRRNMQSAYERARKARAQEVSRIGSLVKNYLTNINFVKLRAN